MKNAIKVLGIIALATLIGFSFASCKDNEPPVPDGLSGGPDWKGNISLNYEGTDVSCDVYLGFNRPNLSCWWDFGGTRYYANGTYSVSGNTVTIKLEGNTSTGTLSENEDTLTFASFVYEGQTINNVTFTKQ